MRFSVSTWCDVSGDVGPRERRRLWSAVRAIVVLRLWTSGLSWLMPCRIGHSCKALDARIESAEINARKNSPFIRCKRRGFGLLAGELQPGCERLQSRVRRRSSPWSLARSEILSRVRIESSASSFRLPAMSSKAARRLDSRYPIADESGPCS